MNLQEQVQSRIIVGLGNPGVEYENTRHNIGFRVLDALGEKFCITGKQHDKFLCWYGKGNIKLKNKNFNLVLCWPTTFVNKSGETVVKLLNYFKLDHQNLIVVHDDVALNLGKIRINFNSGAAGHHGVESIIQLLGGSEEFARLRVGVGPDPGGDRRADYVLRKFSSEEEILVKKVVDLSIEALESLITEGADEAMNKFNGMEIGEVSS